MLLFKEEDCLSAAIDYWLCGNVPDVPVCWGSVVTALESKQVGEAGLAKIIRVKYSVQDAEMEDSSGQLKIYYAILLLQILH